MVAGTVVPGSSRYAEPCERLWQDARVSLPPASPAPAETRIDADVEPSPDRRAASPLARLMLAIGSIALLLAMSTDALAVAGRHAGIRLFGSIEIVQACIVLVATTAIVLTTIVEGHARVHILLDRLKPATASRLLRDADWVSALVFLWLATGSTWLLADLWRAFELTEILHLPLRWLRLAWIIGSLVTAALFVRRALSRTAA
jgi:TRAP-type C4-dicarboxylate transport system permease small subunit